MIFPYMDILENWGNKYALTILAAKRAKQIKDGAPVLIRTNSTNPLTIALEEIALGKVKCEVPETDLVLPESIEPDVSALLSIPIGAEHEEEIEEEAVGAGVLDEETELEAEETFEEEEDIGETLEDELAVAGLHEEDEELTVGGLHDEDETLPIGGLHDDEEEDLPLGGLHDDEDEVLPLHGLHDEDSDVDHSLLETAVEDEEEAEEEEQTSLTGEDEDLNLAVDEDDGIDLLPPKQTRRKTRSKSKKIEDDIDTIVDGMVEDIDSSDSEEGFE